VASSPPTLAILWSYLFKLENPSITRDTGSEQRANTSNALAFPLQAANSSIPRDTDSEQSANGISASGFPLQEENPSGKFTTGGEQSAKAGNALIFPLPVANPSVEIDTGGEQLSILIEMSHPQKESLISGKTGNAQACSSIFELECLNLQKRTPVCLENEGWIAYPSNNIYTLCRVWISSIKSRRLPPIFLTS